MSYHKIIQGVIIGAFGGAFAGIMNWLFNWLQTKHKEDIDKDKIYNWLSKNIPDKEGNEFRSTKTIASYNNLTHDRVRYICSVHDKICESTGKEDNLWGIYGISRKKGED